jgi:hypothetical protein
MPQWSKHLAFKCARWNYCPMLAQPLPSHLTNVSHVAMLKIQSATALEY